MKKTTNANEFISSFNNIEIELKNKYNIDQNIGFTKLIRDVAYDYKDRIISTNLKLLESYASLRNAIVHNKRQTKSEEYIIAEPHDDVVKKIQEIENMILNPPKVLPKYQRDVLIFKTTDSIFKAISDMFSNNFSQIPIYENDEFVGLLNSNTITRWFGGTDKYVDENKSVVIMETKIGTVLKYTEDEGTYKFLNRETYLHDVLTTFEDNKKLEAILITHGGHKSESLLGIITIWDLIDINKFLSN